MAIKETVSVIYQKNDELTEEELIDQLIQDENKTCTLELDSDYFESINGENKSTFLPEDTVFLKLDPSGNYDLYSSAGNLQIIATKVTFTAEETITFSREQIAQTNHKIKSIVSYRWIGNDCGTISFVGERTIISAKEDAVGVLELVYTYEGDRLSLSGNISGEDSYSIICIAVYSLSEIDPVTGLTETSEMSCQCTVNFSIEEDESTPSKSSYTYRLEEDSDYFEIVNGVSRSKYFPTDTVYLKVFPSRSILDYNLFSSLGTLSVISVGVLFERTETVLFTQDITAKTSYSIQSILSTSWSGENGGSVSFNNTDLTISYPVTSILTITYLTKGDRLSLVNNDDYPDLDEFDVLCVSQYNNGGDASERISFMKSVSDVDGIQLTNVVLTIKDVITDIIIPNALVTVTGNGINFSSVADANGRVLIPNLIRGYTYQIKTVSSGYFNSDEDYLNNDSFTVPME